MIFMIAQAMSMSKSVALAKKDTIFFTILHEIEDLRIMAPALVINRLVAFECHKIWIKKHFIKQRPSSHIRRA
jgi:hypothetical protein